MAQQTRRVVTGHDANGKAVFLIDGAATNAKLREATGLVSTLLWVTEESPAELSGGADEAAREIGVAPPPRGSIFRVVDFPPSVDFGVVDNAAMLREMGIGAGQGVRRPVARVVVQEPARAFLHSGLARALEVLSLQGERELVAGRERKARRPDLEVDFVNLAGFQLLRLVVRMPRLPFGRALRIELPLRDAQPALRDRRLGLDRGEEGHLLPLRIES